MNYIYDILVNFNETLYDFYDWNSSDDIKHIRKIPFFKINSISLYEIKNNYVKFDSNFLDKIKDKTEVFKNRMTKNIKYAFLISDGLEVLALQINNKNYYSRLLIDEEVEVLDISLRLDESKIKYEIINSNVIDELKTRKQQLNEQKIKQELKILFNENNIDKLKYIYYECFNKKSNSMKQIINDFEENLNNDVICKLNSFLNLKIEKI